MTVNGRVAIVALAQLACVPWPPTASALAGRALLTTASDSAALGSTGSGSVASNKCSVLRPDDFKHYVDTFNADDEVLYPSHIANNRAWDFLRDNIPFFDCPDEAITRAYYFRWWTFRKHIAQVPKSAGGGWVITEFLPTILNQVQNTISCSAGHHFYEGRWLADPRYLESYAEFWFRPSGRGGNPHQYSFWAADSIHGFSLVHNESGVAESLLGELVDNYRAWEERRLLSDGSFWQSDGFDGMEESISGSGKRPTINSYMYGDARAIASIAELAHKDAIADDFKKKAEDLKQFVQTRLWDPTAGFFKTLPRNRMELAPKSSRDTEVRKFHWSQRPELLGTKVWIKYSFRRDTRLDSSEVYWCVGLRSQNPIQKVLWWRLHAQVALNGTRSWVPITPLDGNYGTEEDVFNVVQFEPIVVRAIRMEVQAAPKKSGGIFEWRVLDGTRNFAPSAETTISFTIREFLTPVLSDGDKPPLHPVLSTARELQGYTPWYFNLPDPAFDGAWRELMDPEGFWGKFGPTTAERRHPQFALSYQHHPCMWNGPSWPYATSIMMTGLASVLRQRSSLAVTRDDYLTLLITYASSHRRWKDDRFISWIDENLDPDTGTWIARERQIAINAEKVAMNKGHQAQPRERGKDYAHSTFCDIVISGLVGLRPRPDDVIEIDPLVPTGEGSWDWFCLDGVHYRGYILSIVWDRNGEKYLKGSGLLLFVNDKLVQRSPTLARITWDPHNHQQHTNV